MGLLGKSKQVKENEAEIAGLQHELANAKAQLRTATSHARDLTQQLDTLQVQYTIRESRHVENIKGLRTRIQHLEEEKSTLEASNTILNTDLGVFRTTAEQRTLEVGTRDVMIQELQQLLARVDSGNSNTVSNFEVKDLLSIVQAQGLELRRLELLVQEKERSLASPTNQFTQKQRELAKLQDQLQKKECDLQRSAEQYARVEKDMHHLRAEWNSCREAYDLNQKKWTASSRQYKNLFDSMKRKHLEELNGALEQVRKVTVDLERSQAAFSEKEQSGLAKQREIDDINGQNENFRQQIADRDRQITTLQHDLDERTETLANARLNLNQTRNQLNIETRKVQTATQEKAEKDKKIEFIQQQCVSLHVQLTAPKPKASKTPKGDGSASE
ncbi:uncharacterized protein BDR25DRAFT_365229 [Lindgomyces ingoldianus]|uniref:Uncharacterized protein n=1 Tax=Lindgomyces ingoldianus TaxID=673940 RepID=A0ACB6RGB6_9PLEO|nr:uncharacterized protein BDR25DRAFT_365229 [Lindgomyces ingoldianus]KAF2478157.1 hypothetical protein BDR25DRAFT_365229 [Lindgomyces ingoldianus]